MPSEGAHVFNIRLIDEDGIWGAVYYKPVQVLFITIKGCTNELAINYNENVNTDDGSCIIYGCTDTFACNFNPEATEGDFSCAYVQDYYDCLGVCLNDIDNDVVCDEYELIGCQDQEADNYDSLATDSGLCEYWGCMDSTACNYDVTANIDDGNCYNNDVGCGCDTPPANTGYDCNGICLSDEDSDGVCDELEVEGCTDSLAYNFNESATEQDDSCTYYPNCQNLIFPSGWSLFSTYMIANDMNLTSILNPINENLIVCKDNDGKVYWPQYGFNGIGDLLIGQGYQIKTNTISGFNLCGKYAQPIENSIELVPGWNMIGYLRVESEYVDVVLNKINSSGNLIMVKDYMGTVYLPEFNFNGIGFMMPGQGYQIKVTEHDRLQY